MVDSTEYGDILGVSVGTRDGKLQGPGGEVLGITLLTLYRSKYEVDGVVCPILSGGYFVVAGLVVCGPLGDS